MIEAKFILVRGDSFSNLYATALLIYYLIMAGATPRPDIRIQKGGQ